MLNFSLADYVQDRELSVIPFVHRCTWFQILKKEDGGKYYEIQLLPRLHLKE